MLREWKTEWMKLRRRNYRTRILDFVKEFNGVSIELIE